MIFQNCEAQIVQSRTRESLFWPVKSTVTVLKFNQSHKMLLRKWPGVMPKYISYIKKHFQCSQSSVIEEIIDTWDEDERAGWSWGRTVKQERRPQEIPFSSISLRRCGCIDGCPGWIIKVFYIISSRELHEFHSETRHGVSFWYKLEMPAQKAVGMPAQCTSTSACCGISVLLMPVTFFKNK